MLSVTSDGVPSAWGFAGNEDGYMTTVWHEFAVVPKHELMELLPSEPPDLGAATAALLEPLPRAEEVRTRYGLDGYEEVHRIIRGELDERVHLLPVHGYGIEARRLGEAAMLVHSRTHAGWVYDLLPPGPDDYTAVAAHLDEVWRHALWAAINSFRTPVSPLGDYA
jgi:hypothetical protein